MNRLLILLVCIGFLPLASAQEIQKCQDDDGKWHYGDHAAAECAARSRITVIRDTGEEVEQIAPPPTQEELAAKSRMQQKLAEQKKLERKQLQLDSRLLATYDNAANIARTRDALLLSIDSYVETDQSYKKKLEARLARLVKAGAGEKKEAVELRHRIQEYDNAIKKRLATREEVRVKYDYEFKRYKELVGE